MEIKFQTIKQNQLIENKFHTKVWYTKARDFETQTYLCQCWHPDYNHRLCEGKCDADHCICNEFIKGSIEIWDEVREVDEIKQREYEGGLF